MVSKCRTRARVGGWKAIKRSGGTAPSNPCARGRLDLRHCAAVEDGVEPVRAWAVGSMPRGLAMSERRTRARVGGWQGRVKNVGVGESNPCARGRLVLEQALLLLRSRRTRARVGLFCYKPFTPEKLSGEACGGDPLVGGPVETGTFACTVEPGGERPRHDGVQ
jgi:hypothetical protein